MSGTAHPIRSRAELADAINAAVHAGAIGTALLFTALYRQEICHQQILPGGSVGTAKRFIKAVGDRPSVLLVGDDDGVDRGPDGFPAANKALDWARWILLHAAGAEREHYHLAIAAAHLHRRVLIIECSTATLPAWQPLVTRARNRVGAPGDLSPQRRPSAAC